MKNQATHLNATTFDRSDAKALDAVLQDAAQRGAAYFARAMVRNVAPEETALDRLGHFDRPLPEVGSPASDIVRELDEYTAPATMATVGGRYFGFVIGGLHPAALAAKVLAAAWGQNPGLNIISPACAKIEAVAAGWLTDLLGLPEEVGVGFVSGATAANTAALATARHALLSREGWDVAKQGLYGAPELKVVVSEESHLSIFKALATLGLGKDRVMHVPVDGQGRMRADKLPDVERVIVCAQAGNLNTGAFDPIDEIRAWARERNAWVHVDAAFGMWALASPALRGVTRGLELADSWGVDGHKWLNVPYDNGLVFVREERQLLEAMAGDAAYLVQGEQREPWAYTPTMSQRARGLEVWSVLRGMGRQGIVEMIERNCRQARCFAEGLREAGYEVMNDVVLNQVMVSFGTPEQTREVIARIQAAGRCWCAGTTWQGQTAMRISVCSWATTDEDVEISLAAIREAAAGVSK